MKIISIVMLGILCTGAAWAESPVGQCVYPKTKVGKDGKLEFKQAVKLYTSPEDTAPQMLKQLSAFSVKAHRGGFIQLISVPDYELTDPDKAAGKIIGWVKLADVKFLDPRNCT